MTGSYILVVDDEPDIRTTVREILEDEGYEVAEAENGEAARSARRDRRPDLILLDIWMPDIDGISLLKQWIDDGGLPCPVIMMSGHGTVETAVEATRLGAYDFIEKPLSLAKLLVTVERGLQADKLYRENIGLRSKAISVTEPIGKSATMQSLREQTKRIAQHDTWVLITGEPGSGKETFARYLHTNSHRRDGPFVDVGVGSIAKQNSAVELFGSEEEGRVQYGRLEQANGGTLFLDEVGDMDPATQTQLLSALETGAFLRVGGSSPVQVDVRIVAATQRNLHEDVQTGRFREDLFYHLNVVPIRVPPLRDHREDIPELLSYYVDRFVTQENLPFRHFSVAAQNHLRNHNWPGNIRELKNLIQRLLILGAGEEVSLDEVVNALASCIGEPREEEPEATTGSYDLPLREAREQFEKAYLGFQLEKAGGSVGKMAKAVGMERTHLYRKLRALGIEIKEKK